MDVDQVWTEVAKLQSQSRRLRVLIDRYKSSGVDTCLVENLEAGLSDRISDLCHQAIRQRIEASRPC
jgi:hypothetical protein